MVADFPDVAALSLCVHLTISAANLCVLYGVELTGYSAEKELMYIQQNEGAQPQKARQTAMKNTTAKTTTKETASKIVVPYYNGYEIRRIGETYRAWKINSHGKYLYSKDLDKLKNRVLIEHKKDLAHTAELYKKLKAQANGIKTEWDLKAAHINICTAYSEGEIYSNQFDELRDILIDKRTQYGIRWGSGI